jgi:hypothetical protein
MREMRGSPDVAEMAAGAEGALDAAAVRTAAASAAGDAAGRAGLLSAVGRVAAVSVAVEAGDDIAQKATPPATITSASAR